MTDEEWAVLTSAYRDPLAATPPVGAQPTASRFSESSGPSVAVRDIESGRDVTVVPYPVWYADGRRFADIVVRDLAEQSCTPMITLSLARYQTLQPERPDAVAASCAPTTCHCCDTRADRHPHRPERHSRAHRASRPTDPSTHEVDIRLGGPRQLGRRADTDLAAELSSINDGHDARLAHHLHHVGSTLGVASRVDRSSGCRDPPLGRPRDRQHPSVFVRRRRSAGRRSPREAPLDPNGVRRRRSALTLASWRDHGGVGPDDHRPRLEQQRLRRRSMLR